MILSAHQPQYLAYTGYFAKMAQADIFILLDTVQFKKNEWINRNRLKGPNGVQFITVPVSFKFGEAIREVKIANHIPWRKNHLQTIRSCYGKAPYFHILFPVLQELIAQDCDNLSWLNIQLVRRMAKILGIKTKIIVASELPSMPDNPDLRLLEICRHFNCDIYLAGAGGRDYMELSIWENSGVKVIFQQFMEPPRKQLFGEFVPNLSIVDLYMNEGEKSLEILRRAGENCIK
jgi:hypothetical protein